ncbi:hypothetical protein JTE90_005943 [Oedothorax gibbosus]|uniref:Uncharacterized protein n=1 Tax=Oedothorax gibbosus TaxID=931172 RepID=A0AAV6UVX8_9ARAC|nr:hypothetical protein JTE90_005943 [Oedothorax gibbosus]
MSSFVSYNITAESLLPTPFSGNPLLPIILLSMAGQKHTPVTTTDIKDSYDYIIIGGGTAGSVVANRLSEEECVSVLLLEAGKAPPKITDIPAIYNYLAPTELSWRFKTNPVRFTGEGSPERSVTLNAGKALGGSSVINGLQNIRGHRRDFDKWAERGATGYHGVGGPVTVSKPPYTSELKVAVKLAATELGYNFTDANGPIQTGFYDLQATEKRGQRSSIAKGYLVPVDDRENLDIVTEAYVTKIKIVDKIFTAYAVEFDFEGQTRIVNATREIILSAGAINSPKLLKLSCIGPKEELERLDIPVTSDIPVGENLQEQWGVLSIFELSPKIQEFKEKITTKKNIWQYITTKTGPLASVSGVSTLAFLSQFGNPPPVEYPDYELYFIEGIEEFLTSFSLSEDLDLQKVYKPHKNQAYFFCLSQVLHPKGRGSVTINTTDPYAQPNIEVEYFNKDDLETVVAGMKTCLDVGNSEPLKKLGAKPIATFVPECEKSEGNEDDYLRCISKSVFISSSHQAGTNKMGAVDDPTTVVDPELRVKGIAQLRVVDASVIPSLTSGNFIPTIMIAEKASDLIKKSISCPAK